MKRMTAAGITLAAFVIVPVAQARLTHPQAVAYGRAYAHVVRVFGRQTAGCKLIGPKATCRHASDAAVRASTRTLRRMLAPPSPQPVSVAAIPTAAPAASATAVGSVSGSGGCGGITPYSGGGQCWAIPYGIVSCESGGQNVPNSQGSGANGYYQLMSGGTGSRAEQDAAAAALWAGGAGASNWVCKG